jgi:peptidyl-prolyl cis-trans isomerase A (cyclophilin A)
MKHMKPVKTMKKTGGQLRPEPRGPRAALFFMGFIGFMIFMSLSFRAAQTSQTDVLVRIETAHGNIDVAVDTAHAPVTSANFLKYVDASLYDGGRFYRVTRPDNYAPQLPNRPAMALIQGGIDPSKNAQRLPPIALERTSVTGLKHVVGTVSMARGGPDSATSEFFILLDDQPSLDFGGKRFDDEQGAAAFGRVVAGLDVVRTIQQQGPLQEQNRQYLATPVPIRKLSRQR